MLDAAAARGANDARISELRGSLGNPDTAQLIIDLFDLDNNGELSLREFSVFRYFLNNPEMLDRGGR